MSTNNIVKYRVVALESRLGLESKFAGLEINGLGLEGLPRFYQVLFQVHLPRGAHFWKFCFVKH